MTRNLQSSFREGKAGTDFGFRTVLCHLLQITIELRGELQQGGRDEGVLAHHCLLPLDDPEGAQCRPSGLHHLCCVTNIVTSRIRKFNTLTVIIQYLNHLHISLVISA